MKDSMKKLIVPLLASAAALAMVTEMAQAQQKKTIALVTNVAADFWTIAGRGLEKAQKEHPDYNIELIVTNEGTAAGQRRELDDLLVRGVAGISISVDDAPHATEELNKVAANTVLITTDSDAPQSKRLAYIGTDNVAAGRQAGEEIKKALPNGGKIALFVGTMDADNARERVQGIKEVDRRHQGRAGRRVHRPGGLRQGQGEHGERARQISRHCAVVRPVELRDPADL